MKIWVIAISAFMAASAASSHVIDITLVGKITYLTGAPATRFIIGETATAMLSFDTAEPGFYLYGDNVYKLYPSAGGTGGSIVIDKYMISIPSSRIFVTNNEFNTVDRFIIDSYSPVASSINGLDIRTLFFNWQASSSYSNSNDIPDTLGKINGYGLPVGAIDYGTNNDSANRIQVNFQTVFLTPIPEPTTWAMMIAGFGLIGVSRRRNSSLQQSVSTITVTDRVRTR